MPLVADLFNVIVGYYVLILAGSAVVGATRALRDPNPESAAAAAVAPASGNSGAASTGGTPATSVPQGRTGRITGLAYSRTLGAFHRFGWATGVGVALGWLAGRDMYRWATPRAAALTARVRDWRAGRRDAPDGETPDPLDPTGPGDASAPDRDPPQTATKPDDAAPPPTPDAGTAARPADDLAPPDWLKDHAPAADQQPTAGPTTPELAAATTRGALPGPEDPHRPGRPWLVVVPAPQEYPAIMPAAEITDLESLIHFTGETATVAGMEAEDAAAASASMIAGAQFAEETAARVASETASLEAAVAAMAMLRVDPESVAAYHALLEAGQVYRDTTSTFSQQCHDAASTAGQMSAAAAHYHETADAALAVLNAHQMPHAEAANATGHGGAEGQFYGVANTGQPALADSGAPALPAS